MLKLQSATSKIFISLPNRTEHSKFRLFGIFPPPPPPAFKRDAIFYKTGSDKTPNFPSFGNNSLKKQQKNSPMQNENKIFRKFQSAANKIFYSLILKTAICSRFLWQLNERHRTFLDEKLQKSRSSSICSFF